MIVAAPSAGQVVPGVLGFLVVAAMGLALFFLLRSLNKQLRKVIPEPRWRDGAAGRPGAGEPGSEDTSPPDQEFSRNGSGQP